MIGRRFHPQQVFPVLPHVFSAGEKLFEARQTETVGTYGVGLGEKDGGNAGESGGTFVSPRRSSADAFYRVFEGVPAFEILSTDVTADLRPHNLRCARQNKPQSGKWSRLSINSKK